MLCERPYRKGVLELGCGRCRTCRINRSRLWVGRMLLESYEHEFSAFVTLTYDEANQPLLGHLCKKHLQLFLKSLREAISPRSIRYYAVGEYGDKTWRPHYHLVIFGLSPMEGNLVQSVWKLGYSFTGTAEAKSMSYVAQYVTKKMNRPKDLRLDGRPPEFCTMSLKPGLGMGVVPRILKSVGQSNLKSVLDITQFRSGSSKYPLGRYLRGKLESGYGVLPEQKREHLRATIERLFIETVSDTATIHEAKRGSRVAAAIGLSKIKTGVL